MNPASRKVKSDALPCDNTFNLVNYALASRQMIQLIADVEEIQDVVLAVKLYETKGRFICHKTNEPSLFLLIQVAID